MNNMNNDQVQSDDAIVSKQENVAVTDCVFYFQEMFDI